MFSSMSVLGPLPVNTHYKAGTHTTKCPPASTETCNNGTCVQNKRELQLHMNDILTLQASSKIAEDQTAGDIHSSFFAP